MKKIAALVLCVSAALAAYARSCLWGWIPFPSVARRDHDAHPSAGGVPCRAGFAHSCFRQPHRPPRGAFPFVGEEGGRPAVVARGGAYAWEPYPGR